jgi:PAS domain S-box-containing protein
LFPPAQQPRLYNLIAQVQRDGVYQDNLVCRRRDGTEFPGEVVGALAEHQGRVQLLLAIRDITARVAAEQARNELYERLDKIASLVPGVVYQFKRPAQGPDCFPYSSEGIREIFRVSPEEVVNDAAPVYAIVHPGDRVRVDESIAESARSLCQWRCEFRTRFPDGTVRWLSGQANPRREPDGAILWHGYIIDITEAKAAEEARRQMEAQLQEARRLEAIGRLAGGVAHDFNNMLQIVTSCAEMALSRLEPGSALHADVLQIRLAANQAADLTRQLLAFSRRQPVEPQPVALNDALARQLRLLRRLIGENIDLQCIPHANPCVILIDPSQLDQVVTNLVVNARDAITGTGHIRVGTANVTLAPDAPEVVAGEVPAGEHVLLRVEDDGAGMSAETVARIFEPFFTTKELGRGTGMGLATVYGIVRQNGGGIHVESTVGVGTTFCVYLPRHRGMLTVAGAPAPHPPAPRGSETVLIAEDEPAIRDLVAEILRRQGYQVLAARHAEDALQLAREAVGPIHLLLTDVVMPQMNGRELMTRIAALHPGIRTLFISGYTSDIIAAEGTIESDLNFLQKPFTAAQLAAKVREVLGDGSK